MTLSLSYKTIFITGATSGFGEACARLFVKEGAKVIATGRRKDRLAKLKKQLGGKVHTLAFDVRDEKAVKKAVKSLPKAFAEVDVLINNAGLALGMTPFDTSDPANMEQMIETNIYGVLYCTQALLPGMIKRQSAKRPCHIVNIGSIAGTYPYPGGHVYGATKAFLHQFSLSLRSDLLGKFIRVTNVEPGMAETEFSLVRYEGDRKRADQVYQGLQPLTGEDIANNILWVITQPAHVNINRVEIMPVMQAFGPFAVKRES